MAGFTAVMIGFLAGHPGPADPCDHCQAHASGPGHHGQCRHRCGASGSLPRAPAGRRSPGSQRSGWSVRIALVVSSYHPRMGGVETHVRRLAQGCAEAGDHVMILTHRLAAARATSGWAGSGCLGSH